MMESTQGGKLEGSHEDCPTLCQVEGTILFVRCPYVALNSKRQVVGGQRSSLVERAKDQSQGSRQLLSKLS